MTSRPPDFDELIGSEVDREERERLLRVHALLAQAGPPPELSPQLEAGPTLAMTLTRRPRQARRRGLLLAAAIALLALAFLGGYLVANNGGSSTATVHVLELTGTHAAPSALASLQIEPVDAAGNWPMHLTVTGLPKLPAHAYYEVYLVRHGKPYAQCGSFIVAGRNGATSVDLNAPYHLRRGDTWVVTLRTRRSGEPGTVVLRPTV